MFLFCVSLVLTRTAGSWVFAVGVIETRKPLKLSATDAPSLATLRCEKYPGNQKRTGTERRKTYSRKDTYVTLTYVQKERSS